MEIPKINAKYPATMNLAPGTYLWCSCGRSKNQPFCDSSHLGTGLFPIMFKIDVQKEVYLCQCKQSKNKPFCDSTHRSL